MLIKNRGTARNEWPLGRVERLIYSEDKIARGAALQTKSGIIKRPINLPLEIRHQNENDDDRNHLGTAVTDDNSADTESNSAKDDDSIRPR